MTDTQLESRRYRRVLQGVWMPTELEDSRELRLEAAKLVLPDRGVLWGLTAAWIYGADVRRLDDLDVHAGFPKGRRVRKQSGLVVCQETLNPSDIVRIDGVQVTTPLRTAFDCLRLLRFAERLLAQIEPLTESPMETRLRVGLTDDGLPRPKAQHEVYDARGGLCGRLDLAYPEAKLGVEYDGADHWLQRQADERRRARIREQEWEVLVYSADDVFKTPLATSAEVRRHLRARLRRFALNVVVVVTR